MKNGYALKAGMSLPLDVYERFGYSVVVLQMSRKAVGRQTNKDDKSEQ